MKESTLPTTLFSKDRHYSQDMETAIIGICLLEKDAFSRTYGLVTEEHFYFDANRDVYAAMRWMYDNNAPIDLLTVTDYLVRKRGWAEFYGYTVGYYLVKCTNHVCSSANLEYYCRVIYEMWIEREIIKLTYSGPGEGNVREKIFALQTKLTLLSVGNEQKDWYDMTDLMIELFRHRDKVAAQGPGILTGLKRLDQTNGGLMNGDMIVLGARPSVGKSAFLGLLAMNMAHNGKKVGIVSLEMSNAKIAGRLAALDTEIEFSVLYRGLEIDENQTQMLYQRLGKTSQLPIYVSDKTEVSIPEIKAKAQKLKHKFGCDILFIDYLQLVDSSGFSSKNSNRENEVRQMSRGCKLMAKELDIPVVVLAQLNRGVTERKGEDRYPKLSDLRESGSIEQDADVVMFLHRDCMSGFERNEDGTTTEREADLIVRKWRDGEPNLRIPLEFDPPRMKFSERQMQQGFKPVQIARQNYYEKDKDIDDPF